MNIIAGGRSVTGVPPTHLVGKNKQTGQVSYSGQNAVVILDWFYEKSNNAIRLDRKFDKFQQLKKNYD